MLFKQKNQTQGTSFFSPQIEMVGNLITKGETRLEGKMVGEIQAEKLDIAKSAKVEGGISCQTLTVNTEVEGDLEVKEKIHILSEAKIKGNIKTAALLVEKGAMIDGRIEIQFQDHVTLRPVQNIVLEHTPLAQIPEP